MGYRRHRQSRGGDADRPRMDRRESGRVLAGSGTVARQLSLGPARNVRPGESGTIPSRAGTVRSFAVKSRKAEHASTRPVILQTSQSGAHADVPVNIPADLAPIGRTSSRRPFAVIRTTRDRRSTSDASGSPALKRKPAMPSSRIPVSTNSLMTARSRRSRKSLPEQSASRRRTSSSGENRHRLVGGSSAGGSWPWATCRSRPRRPASRRAAEGTGSASRPTRVRCAQARPQ